MKPLHQTVFRDPDGRDRGNCVAAALASALDLDNVDEVPHFMQLEEDGRGYWWDLMQAWLAQRGLWMVDVPRHVVLYGTPADALLFATGPSPRDPTGKTKHMVLWRGGVHRHVGAGIVHDPHPDGTGLGGDHQTWGFYALARLDPAARPW